MKIKLLKNIFVLVNNLALNPIRFFFPPLNEQVCDKKQTITAKL